MLREEPWTAAQIGRLVNAKKSGRHLLARCPAHMDRTPSLVIWTDDEGRPGFHCYAGCAWRDVAAEIRARGAVIGRKPRKPPPRDAMPPNEQELRRIDYAKTIWSEGTSCHNTIVERYLATRDLSLPSQLDGPVLRFHARCPRVRERVPAALVGMRDPVSGWVHGIQRIFLSEIGARVGDKMMLGRSGVAMLNRVQPTLHLAEGFESALALHLTGKVPVWAAMCAGNIARLPLIAGVEHLIAYLDNDPSRTGERAGIELRKRWMEAGRTVELRMSNVLGWDPVDEYQHGGL